MYQLSREDIGLLFRLEETDSITRLRMLEKTTIEALERAGITIIEDLLKLEPIALAKVDGVTDDEFKKLETVYLFYFRNGYDNIHG